MLGNTEPIVNKMALKYRADARASAAVIARLPHVQRNLFGC